MTRPRFLNVPVVPDTDFAAADTFETTPESCESASDLPAAPSAEETLRAGEAKVTTRCLDAAHDKACGNECAYYPPLTRGVTVKPAMASEHTFTGKGLNETWSDTDRRGAYVGTFTVR